jgi:hypothetical protein
MHLSDLHHLAIAARNDIAERRPAGLHSIVVQSSPPYTITYNSEEG